MQTHETQEQNVEYVISWKSWIQSRGFQGTTEKNQKKELQKEKENNDLLQHGFFNGTK